MKEFNGGKLGILKEHNEGVFYIFFTRDDEFNSKNYENYERLNMLISQSQIDDLINRCSKDMLEVDKIIKERWLQGEVLETPFTKFVWNGENFSYQLNSSLIRSESQYTKRYKK